MAEEIRAEIVAKIVQSVAVEGQVLAEGDSVVILESMKMEIPILTEIGGTLVSLPVSEGDVVQEGDLIAVLE